MGYNIPNDKVVNIIVKTNELTHGSGKSVKCSCDNCNKIYETAFYRYIKHNHNGRTYCSQCAPKVFNSGENNFNYNPNLTEEDRTNRRKNELTKKWSQLVFKRDNYICLKCKSHKNNLEAHHLDGWNWCVDKRYDVSNGVTLCHECHRNFHSIYGLGNNTIAQYLDWIQQPFENALDYNGNIRTARTAYCLETSEIIENVAEWAKQYNLANTHIYDCLNNKSSNYRGLHFVWYDKYLKMSPQDIQIKIKSKKNCGEKRVIDLDDKIIFESLNACARYYKISPAQVARIVKHINKKPKRNIVYFDEYNKNDIETFTEYVEA